MKYFIHKITVLSRFILLTATLASIGQAYSSTISNVSVSGSVSGGAGAMIGGIVGANNNNSVTSASNSATVTGGANAMVGGIVGIANTSSITSSYNSGAINSGGNAGGLVGFFDTSGAITQSYNAGKILTGTNKGGLYGDASTGASPTITSSYFDTALVSKINLKGNLGASVGGLTTAQMSVDAQANMADLLAAGNWILINDDVYHYPQLEAMYNGTPVQKSYSMKSTRTTLKAGAPAPIPSSGMLTLIALIGLLFTLTIYKFNIKQDIFFFKTNAKIAILSHFIILSVALASIGQAVATSCDSTAIGASTGNGSKASPIIISDATVLANLATCTNAGNTTSEIYYQLDKNITLSAEWIPIGNNTNLPITSFQGYFDGNNKTISGLNITSSGDYQGLFARTSNATISNVNLTNVNISANNYVGALVGRADNTTISNINVSGTIKGGDNAMVGGIVGSSSNNYYAISGTVTGLNPDLTITLTNNDADSITGSNAATVSFKFTKAIAYGGSYRVSTTSPAEQVCYSMNNSDSGTNVQADVSDITLQCKQRDLTLIGWGFDGDLQTSNIPTLGAGLTYTKIADGGNHALALRSDGTIVAWGNSSLNQLAVPPLPTATRYTDLSAGDTHSLALRSDGKVVAWGTVSSYQNIPLPNAQAENSYTAVAAGYNYSLLLNSTGGVEFYGTDNSGLATVPPPPDGTRYTAIAAGDFHAVALLDTGELVAWGTDTYGSTTVPAFDPNRPYTHICAGNSYSIALRSDGTAIGWGDNSLGQSAVPAPPAGLRYTQVACGTYHALLLLSDGSVTALGYGANGQTNVPDNYFYSAVAAGGSHSLALATLK